MTAMTAVPATAWLMLTPPGAWRAFGQPEPDEMAQALQALLGGRQTMAREAWLAADERRQAWLDQALAEAWVEALPRPLQGPDVRLDDFLPHVIASLSGERRAVLASDSGFCLGRTGVSPEQADVLSAAAADFTEFGQRQARRGWRGAQRCVAFHAHPDMLLPEMAFVPFWVDGVGYWLIVQGEPLLNHPTWVELLWGIREAGSRFLAMAQA